MRNKLASEYIAGYVPCVAIEHFANELLVDAHNSAWQMPCSSCYMYNPNTPVINNYSKEKYEDIW